MVSIHCFAHSGDDTNEVVNGLLAETLSACESPTFGFLFYGCDHDGNSIRSAFEGALPDMPYLGGTSCSGVMAGGKLWGEGSIGFLIVDDPAGNFGVGCAVLGDSPSFAAEKALNQALANAGCPGEVPELIWIYQAPGHEEDVVAGLKRLVGESCPIIGGSSADNTVEGNWAQICPLGVFTDAVIVGVMFTSGGVGFSFQGGYEPAGPRGIITKRNGREILEIDDAPAAATYNRWIRGAIDQQLEHGGVILAETTMFPLAVDMGDQEGIPHYRLVHPESVTANGGLSTFATIDAATEIFCMQGDRDRLIERAGRVATEATTKLPGGPGSLAGGLLVYCAGCMMAVGDQMPEVAETVARSFSDMPFLGCFTFGEQGTLARQNVHGNLMISAIAFGNGL